MSHRTRSRPSEGGCGDVTSPPSPIVSLAPPSLSTTERRNFLDSDKHHHIRAAAGSVCSAHSTALLDCLCACCEHTHATTRTAQVLCTTSIT